MWLVEGGRIERERERERHKAICIIGLFMPSRLRKFWVQIGTADVVPERISRPFKSILDDLDFLYL